MNILFVSAIFPFPLVSGGQVRVFNLLKRLSTQHKITLCTYTRSEKESELLQNLAFCESIHLVTRGSARKFKYIAKAITGKYPWVMASYDIEEMKRTITELVSKKNIDLIHLEPGYVYPSLPKVDVPVVVTEHNIEHQVYEEYVQRYPYPMIQQIMKRDVRKLQQWETRIWNQVSAVITVSPDDASYVKTQTKTPVTVVANGVDKDMLRYKPHSIVANQLHFLYVGDFRWIQNIDAVDYLLKVLWPSILHAYPFARLRIVGKDFPSHLCKYVDTSIELVPYVETIADEFHSNDLLIAPIRVGGGTRYKILEAMACGMPVITTEKGIQGLAVADGVHFYLAESENDWLQAIANVLSSSEKTQKMTETARNMVEMNYSWDTIATVLSDLWRQN